jgi:polyisoprenoid-binding protein YceI
VWTQLKLINQEKINKMKKVTLIASIALVAAVSIFATVTAPGTTSKWDVKKSGVSINFELDGHFGTLNDLKADINFNAADLAKSNITAEIQVASLDTKDAGRDKHIKSADFFDAAKYPTIKFVSSSFSTSDEGFTVKGNLTMKDKTFEVSIPFTFKEDTFEGKFSLNTEEYGVTQPGKKGPLEKDNCFLTIKVPVTAGS